MRVVEALRAGVLERRGKFASNWLARRGAVAVEALGNLRRVARQAVLFDSAREI